MTSSQDFSLARGSAMLGLGLAATARHGSFSCSRRHFIASMEMATDGAKVEIVGGEYRAKLGESPVWIDGELVFIDVVAREICVLRDGVVRRATLPKMPGSIVPSTKGGFLAALSLQRLYRYSCSF